MMKSTLPVLFGLSAGLLSLALLSPGQQAFAAGVAVLVLVALGVFFWMQGGNGR